MSSTTGTPPKRTAEQRRQALDRANEIRLGRAKLKRKLKEGQLSPHDVIDSPPAELAGMRVEDMLIELPRWGKHKVGTALMWAEISPRRTVAGLSPRQRASLHMALERGRR